MAEKKEGIWSDYRGVEYYVKYPLSWGKHEFLEVEIERLLSGEEITFKYKGRDTTGHFQCTYFYEDGRKIPKFDFVPCFAPEYDIAPTYDFSLFNQDSRNAATVNEYMIQNFYKNFKNDDGTCVAYKVVTLKEYQDQGMDMICIKDGKEYIIDEKAAIDYIYNPSPLPTFVLELLSHDREGNKKIGWFVNERLRTQYYMFIWPHIELTGGKKKKTIFTVDDITGAYYALVNKKKIWHKMETMYGLSTERLWEYANQLEECKLLEVEKTNTGYRYMKNEFNKCAYLHYTLHKSEKPVNLVVSREWLYEMAERKGTLGEMPS